MDDIAITVEHVSKDFVLPHERRNSLKSAFANIFKPQGNVERQHALHDISFEIKRGEFFGIVGRNGSGKSTLLKILAGIYQPTKGKVQVRGKLVPFIELGVGFNPELTGRENVYLNGAMLGFSEKEVDAMYDDIVSFAELERFMDQKLKNYSSGMQVRLAFSMATRSEADILLVDEVLAVGDADFQKKCFQYFKKLKQQKKTVVFVSHDMSAVEEYCDRAILIEKSEIIDEGTSFDVAGSYVRLFLDSGTNAMDGKRWGSGDVKYRSAEVSPSHAKESDKTIHIRTEAIANKDIETAIFGFNIRAEDDWKILGTNSRLQKQEITGLRKGQKIVIDWEFVNVLNTGKYFVDLAIHSHDYDSVYDSWDAATTMSVQISINNAYPINPRITMAVKK